MSSRLATVASVRLLALCGFAAALPLLGQPAPTPNSFGEEIDIRTGFVRVTLPGGVSAPRAEEFEVLWKRQPQRVLRVVGGATDPLEVGIAVDRSASMHDVFEPMRHAALEIVERGLSENDRLFVVGFTDEAHLLAEGRGVALRVLTALPASPDLVSRPTAFFESLTRTLQLFENAEERAALIVVSDGCDTSDGIASATSVARRARDLAIPIFLLMPDRNDCRNTVCTSGADGRWTCSSADSPSLERRLSSEGSTVSVESMSISESTAASPSTSERNRFSALIGKAGGGHFVVDDPKQWKVALSRIFEQLGRQWTVVFEPTSDDVKSEEIRIYWRADGRRHRLR
ncbi:MAG: VWA domain-containing protein [Thermoanaerobaculia bacterium]